MIQPKDNVVNLVLKVSVSLLLSHVFAVLATIISSSSKPDSVIGCPFPFGAGARPVVTARNTQLDDSQTHPLAT